MDGRSLKVNLSADKPAGGDFGDRPPRGGSSGGTTLFMGNLGFNTTADAVREFFSECGDIKDVRIPFHEDGRPKGFGHVEFETPEAA
jgi:nucleolin